MTLLATDADDLARWKLDETSPGVTTFPSPTFDHRLLGPFVDDIGGVNLHLQDTNYLAANSTNYSVGVPGLFGRPTVAFHGGNSTDQKDFLYSPPNTIKPVAGFTLSAWVLPYAFPGALQTIVCRGWVPGDPAGLGAGNGAWAAPFVSAGIFINNLSDGSWTVNVTVGGTQHELVVGGTAVDGSANRFKLRQNIWNHVGYTHDGAVTRTYINGLAGPTEARVGTVDWNGTAGGEWMVGGIMSLAAGGQHLDGAVTEVRIASIARPLSWFFDMYMSGGGSAGGGPPQVTFS